MVRALISGRKTVTRRIVKRDHPPDPGHVWRACDCREIDPSDTPCMTCSSRFRPEPCLPGYRLWVREAWRTEARFDALPPRDVDRHSAVAYECDLDPFERGEFLRGRYRHARFMPRWASRIDLDVLNVRVERLHDIDEADALAEGVTLTGATRHGHEARDAYAALWDVINGEGSWAANPWVFVIVFHRGLTTGCVT